MHRPIRLFAFLLLIALQGGCVKILPIDDTAREVRGTEIKLSPDHATILIYQSKGIQVPFWIISSHGRVIAQTRRNTHALAEVPAGEIGLYAIPMGYKDSFRARIQGEVEAGRLYYSTLGYGWSTASFQTLTPRSGDNWNNIPAYLETPRVEIDENRVAGIEQQLRVFFNSNLESLFEPIHEWQAKHNEENLAVRTIRPEDGVSSPIEN